MNHHFDDITSRITEQPSWYDAHGTPRYGTFNPDACPNIYASQVGLFRISCQHCEREFLVEMHNDLFGEFNPMKAHYGDPPIHGCIGDTTNCLDLECVELWQRTGEWRDRWERRHEFEGVMTGAWNYEEHHADA